MNKLLLSLLAVATLSLATSSISAKYDSDVKKVEGTQTCNTCNKPMARHHEKPMHHHCQCAHEVCVKPVEALKHAPMLKECANKDRCPEGTVARTNSRGELECVEIRAEEILHTPICDTECTWSCPPGYSEQAMTPGHRIDAVHDEHHVAKKRGRSARRYTRQEASLDAAEAAAAA